MGSGGFEVRLPGLPRACSFRCGHVPSLRPIDVRACAQRDSDRHAILRTSLGAAAAAVSRPRRALAHIRRVLDPRSRLAHRLACAPRSCIRAPADARAGRRVALLGIDWLYYAFMESSTSQATFGKMACGLALTDTYGTESRSVARPGAISPRSSPRSPLASASRWSAGRVRSVACTISWPGRSSYALS
jgi:hypothetical protein